MSSNATSTSDAPEDLAYVFGRHVAATRFEDVPPEAVDAVRKSTLDTIGVILGGGGTTPMIQGVIDIVREAGGREEATIMGFGGKVPSFMAAFANGAMAHCMDYDDHLPEGHHPSSAVIPGVLAMAERIGGVGGRDYVTAVALGQDLFTRLRRNVGWKQDWHLTTILAGFATVAACAKVARLTPQQTVDALGIVFCQTAGTMELAYGTGSDLRGMYAGFSAKAGVLSVLMAQKGITGTRSCFEGRAGFVNVYCGGRHDRAAILDGLGARFLGAEIDYKPWPSCGLTHVYIDGILGLMREHALQSDDIAEIKVVVGDFAQRLCEPIEGRRRPATTVDGKFSIPFSVAVAAVHGDVKVEHFTEAGRRDPAVLRVADKVVAVPDPRLNWESGLPAGEIELRVGSGTVFRRRITDPLGSTSKPMGWADLEHKYADCCRYAPRPGGASRAHELPGLVRGLEVLADVRALAACVG